MAQFPKTRKAKGSLIIIGGAENKDGDKQILEEVARRAKKGKRHLVVITIASQKPEENAKDYTGVFNDLGIDAVDVLDLRNRDDGYNDDLVKRIAGASMIFFTGGDQLRITSQLGDTPVFRCMRDFYREGGTIAGTSAGAAAMSETMMLAGPGDESYEMFTLDMAPGLGFVKDLVIDTHFAERGRMGRLLAAVSQNPRNLGIGIDEDTAIIVEGEDRFSVMGSGAVYVLDGRRISYSSLSDTNTDGILCMHDVTLHVLGNGSHFDLVERRPIAPADVAEKGA